MNTSYIIYDRAGRNYITTPRPPDSAEELESAFREQTEDLVLVPVHAIDGGTDILHIHGNDIISLRKGI